MNPSVNPAGFYFCGMNILILGSGGREHALAWKVTQSPSCQKVFIAPGNAGTASVGENINIDPCDFEGVAKVLIDRDIALLLVGPEAPLVEGIRDYFEAKPEFAHLRIIGPGRLGAQMEGSKDFAKAFMSRHGIPTARYGTFTKDRLEEAKEFLETFTPPYVLKADGLAAGKGVVIPHTIEEARKELDEMLGEAKFGEASAKVVIEEFLSGIELSVFALSDGKNYVLLPEAKDYKRIGEGDTGLNTGGMGAVSPVPFADKAFMQKVKDRVVEPTIKGLAKDGIPYVGFVFFGLIEVNGEPYVIEYNARMGDPETEVVMPRIASDFLELLIAAADGKLDKASVEFDSRVAATVMLVSGGYPGAYAKGKAISGLENVKGALCFHAGTSSDGSEVRTAGGRVIALSAYGSDMKGALETAYEQAGNVQFEDMYFRKDIGYDL